MSDTAQTVRNVVTPRKIAWVLLLGGAAWFVSISPKTPLQFFDAANRDYAASSAQSSDESPSSQARLYEIRLYEALMLVFDKKRRLELSYDMINDSARVHRCRGSILHGMYQASSQTRETLMRHNSAYQSLVKQIERGRLDLEAARQSRADAPNPVRETQEDADLQTKRFQTVIDRMILRQFQSKLFWWGR